MKYSTGSFRRLGVCAAALGVATAAVGTAAFAEAPPPTPPTVTITSPTSASVLTYSSFPVIVPVTGTVAFTGGQGEGNTNLCAVKELTVKVNGVPIGYLDKVATKSGSPDCEDTSTNWSYNWSVPGAGTYTILATAKVTNDLGTDTEEVVVFAETVTADYPAAPAVAAHILKEKNVSPKYGTAKNGGNYISDVAAHMGPQTDFNGVSKEDVEEYRAAVYAFLEATPAF